MPTSSRSLFGTDGIRAPFGEYPLDRSTVTALGEELAGLWRRRAPRPSVVLGGDTRESTPELCRWLAAGLSAGGASIRHAGILPTPGVAALTRTLGAAGGVAVSASHNPHPDNGLKLIDGQGFKWSREAEVELEARLTAPAGGRREHPPPPGLEVDAALPDRYLEMLAAALPGPSPLAGLRVTLDCAHGAASPYAGEIFGRLGADARAVCCAPDGRNINDGCGSTAPEAVARATVASGSHLGVALDGDADRALFADGAGAVHDGDVALYLWAKQCRQEGRLDPPRIVATVMSNLGLERALARQGIEVVRCEVGDRAVVETMCRRGILLGGEQSGHIVHLGLSTTGDGLLTALQIAYLVSRSGRSLAELAAEMERLPQVLKNVPVSRRPDFDELPRIRAAAREARETLGGKGRLLLRYSGTEPLARVMIEGEDRALIESLAQELAATIREELG